MKKTTTVGPTELYERHDAQQHSFGRTFPALIPEPQTRRNARKFAPRAGDDLNMASYNKSSYAVRRCNRLGCGITNYPKYNTNLERSRHAGKNACNFEIRDWQTYLFVFWLLRRKTDSERSQFRQNSPIWILIINIISVQIEGILLRSIFSCLLNF